MSAPHRNNFLAAEPHIVARLKAALADIRPAVHVLTSDDLSKLEESNQPTPAVHVVWSGLQASGTQHPMAAQLAHTWLIVAVVRNVRGLASGSDARKEAGELMARAGEAVLGFRPPNVSSPMRLAPRSPGAVFKNGVQYLPLAFLVESMFHGTLSN